MRTHPISILLSMMLIAVTFNAHAGGSSVRGGGDLCEDRIKVIRDDLRDWINKGGANGLTLPSSLTESKYSAVMLREISQAKIRCVAQDDKGYPVTVEGTPKVCRFDRASNEQNSPWITCDANKFRAMSESDQYVLIHHEYAGLAGVEEPNKDDSTYDVSNQISDYLVDTVVKKLAVKGQTVRQAHVSDQYILCSYYGASTPAIKINTKELEADKCPIVLPTRLSDFQFRISRHRNSGLLRIVIENKKTGFWMRSLGGNNELSVSLALSESDGKDAADQLGLTGSKIDELEVSCRPSWGMDSESYLLVTSPDKCVR